MPPPAVDRELCVRHRFAGASCRACADACPVGAIIPGRGLSIDPRACKECGLCSPACPNGAISGAGDDLAFAVPALARREMPALGCRAALESRGQARIRCFGGLDARDLAVLAIEVGRPLVIDAAPCRSCRAGPHVLPVLQERLSELHAHAVLPPNVGLTVRDHVDEGERGPESASRRGFLRLVGDLAGGADRDADPRLADRRRRLASAASHCDDASARWLLGASGATPVRRDGCDDCCRCAAVCPTSALVRTRHEGERRLGIDTAACTGCGACEDFCPRQAITIVHA